MRKSVISNGGPAAKALHKEWKDLNRIARVEITSEDTQFPIEHAFGRGETTGWRAARTGPQIDPAAFR